MKTEDFERLKKLCDENGFELVTESPDENDKFFVVKKKDEWGGVEFAEFHNGSIKKIISINNLMIYASDGRYGAKTNCKPSTEQAYIEQLKKEAFKRFGEIKEGDRFLDAYSKDELKVTHSISVFLYSKDLDSLCIGGVIVYHKGKWAERVKESVKVEFINHYACANTDFHSHVFNLSICRNADQFDPEKAGKFLAEQLEIYLNNKTQ